MKIPSNCGNYNAYNAANGSASANEDSSDESIDINRDLFTIKKRKNTQIHEADGILAHNNETVARARAPILVPPDSAENEIRSASENSVIAVNESGSEAALVKDDDELRLARRRQSNRESAKRCRIRKQEEFTRLQAEVEELKAESSALKDQLFTLSEKYVQLKNENESILVELRHRHRENAISYLEALMPGNLSNGEGYRREENSTLCRNRYASPPSLNVQTSSSINFRL